jgi:hypothetical protein
MKGVFCIHTCTEDYKSPMFIRINFDRCLFFVRFNFVKFLK